jgi:hypothetical protein
MLNSVHQLQMELIVRIHLKMGVSNNRFPVMKVTTSLQCSLVQISRSSFKLSPPHPHPHAHLNMDEAPLGRELFLPQN